MPLFGSNRDSKLIRSFNNEIINRIICQQTAFYKLNLDATSKNLYGESKKKFYYNPIKVGCLIQRDGPNWDGDEHGMDYGVTAEFAFLRDDLIDLDLVPEVGDILLWDTDYYELDGTSINQYWGGKNPDTEFGGDGHGYNISVVCTAHITRKSKINIEKTRFGTGKTNNLPTGM